MRQNPGSAKMRLYEEESSPEAISRKFGIDVSDIVDFSVNVNPFAPPPVVFDEAAKAIKACGVYPDLHLKGLRQLLSKRHGLDEGCFMFGAGLDDVLKLISQAWLGASKVALTHIPTFPRYELEARIVGASLVFVESDTPWQIDVTRIRAALDAQHVDVAYLCSPNNPTGARINVEDIEDLVAEFPATKFIVDEALADPGNFGAIPMVNVHSNLVVLRTFSKYFGLAGLRVGYAVGQTATVFSLTSVRPPFNVSGFSARMAMAALENDDFLATTRKAFKAEREFVVSELKNFPGLSVRGSCSNMMLISIDNMPAAEFVGALARHGVLVVDATSFRGLENVPSVRVSLRTRAENTRLIDAISAVGKET